MSQERTISNSDVLLLFQAKISAANNYNRNFNKQHHHAEAIYQFICRAKALNVNKSDIVNTINELVEKKRGSQHQKLIKVMTHSFRTTII